MGRSLREQGLSKRVEKEAAGSYQNSLAQQDKGFIFLALAFRVLGISSRIRAEFCFGGEELIRIVCSPAGSVLQEPQVYDREMRMGQFLECYHWMQSRKPKKKRQPRRWLGEPMVF